MSTEIRPLTKKGVPFYPQTHVKAIVNDNGSGVDSAPTKNSNNLVESGGVFSAIFDNTGAFDISRYNAINGVLKSYSGLTDALSEVPQEYRSGGMTVKFVLSSDNKYVQFRYMPSDAATAATFTNPANWQGVDATPTENSHNLVESGGVEADTRLKFQKLPILQSKYAIVGVNGENIWYGDTYSHIVIPVSGGESVSFVSITSGLALYCAFLTAYPSIPVANTTPDFLAGYVGRQTKSTSFVIPNGCKFFVVNNTQNYSSITINGVNVLNGIWSALQGFGEVLSALNRKAEATSGIISQNIANPANIEQGLVGSTGAINRTVTNWKMVRIPLSSGDAGKKISFGGFYLGRTGYAAFYNGETMVGSLITYADPNGLYDSTTINITIPSGASDLYIDIMSANSTIPSGDTTPYDKLQVNFGETLLPYDVYKEEIVRINGMNISGNDEELAASVKSLEDRVTILEDTNEDLIADLPLSADGAGIDVGYAYINSSTGVVTIKLS